MKINKEWVKPLAWVLVLASVVAYPLNSYLEQRATDKRWVAQKKADGARFDALCKNEAVYKIYKIVKNVDAIQLLKIRQEGSWGNQMEPGAALAKEYSGDSYIKGFLMQERSVLHPEGKGEVEHMKSDPLSPRKRGNFNTPPDYVDTDSSSYSPGYKYVYTYEDGVRYRVTLSKKIVGRANSSAYGIQLELKKDPNFDLNIYRWSLERVVDNDPPPRYAVTFEDHVIPEDRARGFASSRIIALDTQTNEVLGEVTVYAWGWSEPSHGNETPWLNAYSCPGNPRDSGHTTRAFVDQVLMPTGSAYAKIN